MMRTFRVTLADERFYSFDIRALCEDEALATLQDFAACNDDDARFRDLAGSFHDVVSCVEVCL